VFTGIVEGRGRVVGILRKEKDAEITIAGEGVDLSDAQAGESIAVSGVCLTVTSCTGREFTTQASRETLSKTTLGALKAGSHVNLERSVRLGGRLGGHIVTGHVDGVGRVERIERSGESLVFTFSLPPGLSRYVVQKGSIAIDGVSLTVNEVRGDTFTVNIIPYTQQATVFPFYKVGDGVNIECDIIAKYVEKLLGEDKGRGDARLKELLEKL
jgi:riboflavin synthase